MNISFLSSGHYPYDDRIFYHLGKSLSENGHKVEITSSKSNEKVQTEGISCNCFEGDSLAKSEKTERFIKYLENFEPDVIICSEPLPVLAARRYKRKAHRKIRIIYDITEWYPSKKNLVQKKTVRKCITFFKLLLFNIHSSSLADAFIFGEWYKSKPYRLLFPFKPFIFTTYYPDLRYIRYKEPGLTPGKLRLSYSGKINLEKGFSNFIKVIKGLSMLHPDLRIEVKITGWFESDNDRKECEPFIKDENSKIDLVMSGRQNFIDFNRQLNETDIFLDLRADTLENQHCLPIRLFYYAANGRPVVFSDLKAIRREVEIEKFGFLVKPRNTDSIVSIISEYLGKSELYYRHCREARALAERKYNWKSISAEFMKFIESPVSQR